MSMRGRTSHGRVRNVDAGRLADRQSCPARFRGCLEADNFVVVVLVVPICNFAGGREPDTIVRFDVLQHLMERSDAMRLPNHEGMKRHAYDHAVILALAMELVKAGLDH